MCTLIKDAKNCRVITIQVYLKQNISQLMKFHHKNFGSFSEHFIDSIIEKRKHTVELFKYSDDFQINADSYQRPQSLCTVIKDAKNCRVIINNKPFINELMT